MPPLASWFRGRDEIAVFLGTAPLNGRLALAPSCRRAPTASPRSAPTSGTRRTRTYRAFALDVLTLRGDRIADDHLVHHRTTQLPDGDDFLQWPHYPADPALAAAYFEAFGLPSAWILGRPVARGARPARARHTSAFEPPADTSSQRAIVSCEAPPSSWATSALALALGQAREARRPARAGPRRGRPLVRVGRRRRQHRRVGLEVGRAHRAAQHVEACGCARS